MALLRLYSQQHSKMLWHRCDILVETVHGRTHPVWWRFREYAWWRWTAKFRSCVRNYRRVSSVLASSSTWNVDRSRKSRIQSNRSRFLNRFNFNRTVISESWTLLWLIFVINTVLIRQNSMALCHWCSERHYSSRFGSEAIAAERSVFLSLSDSLSLSSLIFTLLSTNSSLSRSKQRKGRIKLFLFLNMSLSAMAKPNYQLKWWLLCFASSIMIASWTNQLSSLRKKCHGNSQSASIYSPHPNHVTKNDVLRWKWDMF